MFSVIIPTLNEEKALPQTLSSLLNQKWLHEIIVVDGGSNDATLSVAQKFSNTYLQDTPTPIKIITATRGRAKQMNVGAKTASGQWLLFLHADTQLPKYGLDQLYHVAEKPDVLAACFKQTFSNNHWGLGFISWLHNWRFRFTKIMYGDQAIAVKRAVFEHFGGFPEQMIEDILLSKKLLTICTPYLLNLSVITDARKFEQIGIWRALRYVIQIQLQHRCKNTINCPEFFQYYR